MFIKLKLLFVLNTLLLVFAIAALARPLEGLKGEPARAEVRVLLTWRGVVGMMGVMWVVPARLLKLYMLLEKAGAGVVVSENPPRFIIAMLFCKCVRPYLASRLCGSLVTKLPFSILIDLLGGEDWRILKSSSSSSESFFISLISFIMSVKDISLELGMSFMVMFPKRFCAISFLCVCLQKPHICLKQSTEI